MNTDEQIGKLVRSRGELRKEQREADEFMRRLGQLLLHVQQLLEEGYEIQLYEYFVGTAEAGSGRVEDVVFEGRSLREQVVRFRQIKDQLYDVELQLEGLGVDK